jgi:hypothetical protein
LLYSVVVERFLKGGTLLSVAVGDGGSATVVVVVDAPPVATVTAVVSVARSSVVAIVVLIPDNFNTVAVHGYAFD